MLTKESVRLLLILLKQREIEIARTGKHDHVEAAQRSVSRSVARFQTQIARLSVTHTARSRGWRCEHVEELPGLRFSREKRRIARLVMCSGIARLRDAVNMMRDFRA